jgi:hypothetical protein
MWQNIPRGVEHGWTQDNLPEPLGLDQMLELDLFWRPPRLPAHIKWTGPNIILSSQRPGLLRNPPSPAPPAPAQVHIHLPTSPLPPDATSCVCGGYRTQSSGPPRFPHKQGGSCTAEQPSQLLWAGAPACTAPGTTFWEEVTLSPAYPFAGGLWH